MTIEEVVSSVSAVIGMVSEIGSISGEQTDSIREINQSIGRLNEMIQQNAALV